MAKGKKYNLRLEQIKDAWTAQIIRQVTAKKVVITKQQNGFVNEAQAREWAETTLVEFTATLKSSNQRHGELRKTNEEERRLRSSRRAEKSLDAKQEKLQKLQSNEPLVATEGD